MKADLVVIDLQDKRLITSRLARVATTRLARRGLRITGRWVAGRMEIAEMGRAH